MIRALIKTAPGTCAVWSALVVCVGLTVVGALNGGFADHHHHVPPLAGTAAVVGVIGGLIALVLSVGAAIALNDDGSIRARVQRNRPERIFARASGGKVEIVRSGGGTYESVLGVYDADDVEAAMDKMIAVKTRETVDNTAAEKAAKLLNKL